MYQRPLRFNLLPDVIKNLLIINGLFFLATIVVGSTFGIDLGQILGLYMPGSPSFEPYQLITHMFMHGNFSHIFFNMFALWMFGYTLENVWGSKRFLIYYLVTGLGAAFIHLGVNYIEAIGLKSQLMDMGYTAQQLQEYVDKGVYFESWPQALKQYTLKYGIPTVGASGAVFGVLLAFGMMFPNMYIYVYFAIPIKAKYFVAIYGALELFSGIQNDPDSNVA
ncbi:MAG: rhomboid family intramembrane serine protease, partial [Owenweeksia sp.]